MERLYRPPYGPLTCWVGIVTATQAIIKLESLIFPDTLLSVHIISDNPALISFAS